MHSTLGMANDRSDQIGSERSNIVAIVRVELGRRPQEQRDGIIKGITDVLIANGAKPEDVEVLLYEVDMQLWGKGGKTFAQRAAEQGIRLPH